MNKSCAPCNWIESDRQNICEFSRHDWKYVSGKYSSKFTKSSAHSTLQDIATTNRYDVLSEIQSLLGDAQGKVPGKTNNAVSIRNTTQKVPLRRSETKLGSSIMNERDKPNRRNVKNEKEKNRKMIILGDSHARGLSGKLKDILRENFEFIGYTKPNCNIKSLIASAQADIAKLANNDVLFFKGGTKDVLNSNTDNSLSLISQFAQRLIHTNVVVASVPHRYDLSASSKVNHEIRKFNRKLKKYVKPDTHVTVLNVDPDRNYFTNHGLLLNSKGKTNVCVCVCN